jgi:hypothetical protein
MCDSGWTDCHWDGGFSEYFDFLCQYLSINSPYSLSYFKLLFNKGQMDEAWKPCKKGDDISEIGKHQERKAIIYFSGRQRLNEVLVNAPVIIV